MQRLNRSELESLDAFYEALGQGLAEELDLDVLPANVWDAGLAPNFNFEHYLRTEVLEKDEKPVIWALDEVDRLFSCPFRSEVFGLFRTWHNQRAGLGKHADLWGRLTLIIAYATEAHLFITDLDQSPFNVGTQITLEDFTPEQVAELNRRYDRPLHNDKEQKTFYDLVGGHPYLTNRGLYELAENNLDLASFQAQAARDEGPFGDHLRRIVVLLGGGPGVARGHPGGARGPAPPHAAQLLPPPRRGGAGGRLAHRRPPSLSIVRDLPPETFDLRATIRVGNPVEALPLPNGRKE